MLGILNKLITAPLRRINEQKGHILQMCDIYLKMDSYFDECLKSDNRIERIYANHCIILRLWNEHGNQ